MSYIYCFLFAIGYLYFSVFICAMLKSTIAKELIVGTINLFKK